MTTSTARYVETIMGMPITLALRGRRARSSDADDAWQSIVHELRDVDRVFSTYREDSSVSRLARGEIELADCPPEVAEVLRLGAEAEEMSGGAFSVHLRNDSGTTMLDPAGIVKGWAVDRAARYLDVLDDTDHCLSAGGDMVCQTDPAHELSWRIGIEDPLDPRRYIAIVPIRDGAVATSGITHRGAHIVDPHTGRPPEGITSVTVVGDSLTAVDVEATAAFAHGPDAAAWLRLRPNRTGLVVWSDGQAEVFRSES